VPGGPPDLLWSVPVKTRNPNVCVGVAACVKRQTQTFHIELLDGSNGENVWSLDIPDEGLTGAVPLMLGRDLNGDQHADVLLGIEFESGLQQVTALSGVNGARMWTVDTVLLEEDPPTVLPNLGGGPGHDVFLWEGWYATPEEGENLIFRIRLRRIDGATGNELFNTQHDLTDGPESVAQIWAYSLGDLNGDGALDIGHALWRYSGSWEQNGQASTVLRIESGIDGSELWSGERDRKALLFKGGDWVPDGQLDLFEGSVSYNDTDFRLAALEMPSGATLWSRMDIPYLALFGTMSNPSGQGDSVVYGRIQNLSATPRWRSRIDVLRGRTGTRVWGMGPSMGDPPLEVSLSARVVGGKVQYSDKAVLEAVLTDPDGVPLEGADLSISLLGTTSVIQTDEAGKARLVARALRTPGTHPFQVSYAGSADNRDASIERTFPIVRETTSVELKRVRRRVLVARLADRDTRASVLRSRKVTFWAGDHRIGTARTDASGTARLEVPRRFVASRVFRARFAGDPRYVGSQEQLRL
jgi:hypothetical protein